VNQSGRGSEGEQVTVVLATGGTIAGRAANADDHVGYVAGQVAVQDLLDAVPGLHGLPLESEQVAQIDSKDMALPVWQALVRRLVHHLARPEIGSIVITHGTDTLEETAYLLQMLLQPVKPVVLTCAMRPATALMADGPQNLRDAVVLARHPGATGVLVACAGQVFSARTVTKVHTHRLDAFDGGEAGALAVMENGSVRPLHPWPAGTAAGLKLAAGAVERFLAASALPRVEMLTSHADADGDMVQALLAHQGQRPLRGIVIAGTGNGSVHERLAATLEAAQAQGIRVVRTSRCVRGEVLAKPDHQLPQISPLSAVKARLALALELLGG
jgi:L-asparaginase